MEKEKKENKDLDSCLFLDLYLFIIDLCIRRQELHIMSEKERMSSCTAIDLKFKLTGKKYYRTYSKCLTSSLLL